MKNLKILNKENLLENLSHFSAKKVCAMVKADAYGHGLEQIIKLLDDRVFYFGVAHVEEAVLVRKWTQAPILVCSKVDDFKKCARHNLDVMVEDESDVRLCLKYGLKDNMHLKINCGMNRFGVNSVLSAKVLNDILEEERINLKTIYTHFPCTENKKLTWKNYYDFQKLRAEMTQNAPICFGGSYIVDYPFDFDIVRVGLGLYGYGNKNLKPVMKICSFIEKIAFVKKGQFVGYGTKFKAKKDILVAIVPVGYGDGLRRGLSGKFSVKINGKSYRAIGNICMDAFFVQVDKSVKTGDVAIVMDDADGFAEKLQTIPYEILTGFSSFRGKTFIVDKK